MDQADVRFVVFLIIGLLKILAFIILPSLQFAQFYNAMTKVKFIEQENRRRNLKTNKALEMMVDYGKGSIKKGFFDKINNAKKRVGGGWKKMMNKLKKTNVKQIEAYDAKNNEYNPFVQHQRISDGDELNNYEVKNKMEDWGLGHIDSTRLDKKDIRSDENSLSVDSLNNDYPENVKHLATLEDTLGLEAGKKLQIINLEKETDPIRIKQKIEETKTHWESLITEEHNYILCQLNIVCKFRNRNNYLDEAFDWLTFAIELDKMHYKLFEMPFNVCAE